MRVLIAGVGYHNLRDLSVGPTLVPRLREMKWPPGIEVDDWSFGPIAVLQRLQDRPNYYARIVFVSAAKRGREPGHVYTYRWDGNLPCEEEIQRRVGEAVTGVISLDNLLIITEYFGLLPSDVIVVEVEPEDTNAGLTFTPRVEKALNQVIDAVRAAVLDGMMAKGEA